MVAGAEPFELYSTAIDLDPYPGYANLRDTYPCYWSESARVWILSRYDDVLRAAQDWQTYSSKQGNLVDEIPGRSGGTLGTTDPPRHDRLRALVQAAFFRKNIGHMTEPTKIWANRALDQLRGRKTFDFVAAFSSVVTVNVLFEMLGLPARDPLEIRDLVVASMSTDKKLRGRNPTFDDAFVRLTDFVSEQVAARRADPRDDLITSLAEAEIYGDRLSDREVVLTTSMFVIAGVESLSSFMSIFVMNLAQFPDARHTIVANPDLLPDAIEESLRYNTSAQRFKRVLTRDIELHGENPKAGDTIVLAFGAANRDERKFPDPNFYDVGRRPQGHLGFGAGKHFCIGAQLARLVVEQAMRLFLERFPDFDLVRQDFDWVPSSNFRNPVELPLALA